MSESIVLPSKCTWKTLLPSESPGCGPVLIWSMSYSRSVSKEVHQLCTPLWEQLRTWMVSCSMRATWPNKIMHLHEGLNYVAHQVAFLLCRELVNPMRKEVGNTSSQWAAMSSLTVLQLNWPPCCIRLPSPPPAAIDQGVAMALDASKNAKWAIGGLRKSC